MGAGKKIKLERLDVRGFKSFADPTPIIFQGNITAVVGPNGCGKSNVIDAVRWVMGESSAKQLRGDMMSDVIFNGTDKRKSLGQASVELFFDNSDALFGGEYAKYNQIAIRREITRDGFSDYYLNNVRCRRKDIVNIFLGTGLGSQSYAIIGQGTISQFIDAKPDELRMCLEEAAGISKYKERRRETENRIKHTRENLLRLNDLREEIDKQLRHLKSQANTAERYKKLKQEERLTKAQLHILHWRELAGQSENLGEALKKEEINLEEKVGAQHVCAAQIAERKEKHSLCTDAFNAVQAQYYKVGSDIARLEQQIHFYKERQKQLKAELDQLEKSYQETETHAQTDQGQVVMLEDDGSKLKLQLNNLQEAAEEAEQKLRDQESAMHDLQGRWDDFNAAAAKIEQQIEVLQTKIVHDEASINKEQQNLAKLHKESSVIAFVDLAAEINILTEKENFLQEKNESLQNDLANKQQQIGKQRTGIEKLSSDIDALRGNLQGYKGRLASLEALQQAALGKNESGIMQWLQHRGLLNNRRLLQEIKVSEGWEKAVETVLDVYLEAVCVDKLETIFSLLHNVPQGQLMFLSASESFSHDNAAANFTSLASKVVSNLSITRQLNNIYVSEDLAEAEQKWPSLSAHESIITKDGVWLGKSWLRIGVEVEHKFGVLQREKELRALQSQLACEQEALQQKEQELQDKQNELVNLEQQYYELQKTWQENNAVFARVHGDINAKQKNVSYLQEREQVIKKEMDHHAELLAKQKQQLLSERELLQSAVLDKESFQEQSAVLVQERTDYTNLLADARSLAANKRKEFDAAQMRLELAQKQIGYLQLNLQRLQKQLADLTAKRVNISASLEEIGRPLPDAETELEQKLIQRLQVEHEMQVAKQEVMAFEDLLQELEQKRAMLQEDAQMIRTSSEELRIKMRELQTRRENHAEQIKELEYDLQALIAELPEVATVLAWADKLAQLVSRVERLGPINLAAINEFAEQFKRKEYLDEQNNDLVAALETLENAMRKIDQDTKERFQETFDVVNNSFQNLFAKVFSGGSARLELVSDDLLNTGVIISAQPPGKRNTSIHLLSGGEKALTAIALVFSIFQLNPAPFCMLDEVDAPLDDANVGRFCNLMKEMAVAIQLIFISHNKLTLEIADQLTGVTMQEAGVSRIVSVDIDMAMALAGQ